MEMKEETVMKVESTKELIGKLHDMVQEAAECIDLLQNAFIYDSSKYLDECEVKAKEIRHNGEVLTQEIIEEAKGDTDVRMYVSVPGHIERLGKYIENIINSIRAKIREGILCSDKAVSEFNFLMQRTQEVLKNTSDIILARNVIIRDYVKSSAVEISRSADEYATKHEERLIEGVCMPKASPMFLDFMDAVKGIAWHAKEIAEKLTVT
jgi:Na+/phosphate symporter